MAVFTSIDRTSLQTWLSHFRCGDLLSYEGISQGIENTNYFVNTTAGRFVLTLFEKLTADDLPFYLAFMKHLSREGLAVPEPQITEQGALFMPLFDKPAALVACLPGNSTTVPDTQQCSEIGRFLATAHLAAQSFPSSDHIVPINPRGLAWWQSVTPELEASVSPEHLAMIRDELRQQEDFHTSDRYLNCPRTAVHADLFRDNALFEANRLGGVIDFYFAGLDSWIYDVAVCVNDWCIEWETGAIQPDRYVALISAYEEIRPFTEIERACWPMALRAAAFRFWLSRLFDWHQPRSASLLEPKDPRHFEKILRLRRNLPAPSWD